MNQETLNLFRTLTELPGASGFEHSVRRFMKEELKKYSDEILQDRLGSVFRCEKKGDENGPRVMVAGHMDEVGFMVTQITKKNGMIRFQPLGGWWSQVLLAQRVQIITDDKPIIGVIASIPPHILSDEMRAKPMDIKICSSTLEPMIVSMRWLSGSSQDSKLCRYARLRQWQTTRKFLQKHGIIVMDAA
ncbi:hypothetical protein GCM10020331_031100 [Ectobacillus funiculus]